MDNPFKQLAQTIFPKGQEALLTPEAKALNWIRDNSIKGEGIILSTKNRVAYPEVTGYLVPTLMEWNENELAKEMLHWLIKIQNDDGSFSATDETPYTFDTGQVLRGLVAGLNIMPELEVPIRKASDWLLTQIQDDGRLDTPSTELWDDLTDDRIHLYVLPALKKAGEVLNVKTYAESASTVLKFYKNKSELIEFNTLSHFYAYIIEALVDLEEEALAKKAMEQVARLQKPDGSVPAYKDGDWTCLPGLAQFAVIWFKLGENGHAGRALNYLIEIQNKSGGFYGSFEKNATYFKNVEISWAPKYFLDALYLEQSS